MSKLSFGDIVLLKFPFTDGSAYKKRPALIINDFKDGDVIVCRITSHIYDTIYDVGISDWGKFGLKLHSVIRVHKLATLDKNLVEKVLGHIDTKIKEIVRKKIGELPDCL